MQEYIKVRKLDAEKLRVALLDAEALSKGVRILHDDGYVYIPVNNIDRQNIKKLGRDFDFEVTRRADAVERKVQRSYAERLSSVLPKKDIDEIAGGYEALGNIAIVEIPEKLYKGTKGKKIGRAIIESSRTIGTVLAKAGPVSGRFRTRKFAFVAGKRTYIANYRENGCMFRFDVRKVFFSSKLSFERRRIAKAAGDLENIAVPFAGVGPFAIEIAKAHPTSRIMAIELNRHAYKYMLENIGINKVGNVVPVLGDFAEFAEKNVAWADRVVMPMPKAGLEFVIPALRIAKRKANFHLYAFCEAEGGADRLFGEIEKIAADHGRRISLVSARRVRNYSSSEIEVVIDFKTW